MFRSEADCFRGGEKVLFSYTQSAIVQLQEESRSRWSLDIDNQFLKILVDQNPSKILENQADPEFMQLVDTLTL
jgi:hypothetical protein